MQQLTLQFDGYADSRPVIDVGTTKKCSKAFRAFELSYGWAMKQKNAVAAIQRVGANLKLYAQGVLCVAFVFGIMFLAALIGG